MIGVLSGGEGREALLRDAMALLQVASVLSESPGTSAVLWSSAQTLTAAEPFRRAVAKASAKLGVYPFTVLCRFTPFQSSIEDGTLRIGAVATGLARFIGRDLEFAPRPQSLMDMMNSMGLIAGWLLQGLEIEDGHTYGRSDRERIRIHVADAGQVLSQPVFLCEVEELDPSVGERLQ